MENQDKPITANEIKKIADKISVGDKIRWKVWDSDLFSRKGKPSKKTVLTVTRKSKFLLEAAGKNGRIYSIRYAEIAEEKRRAKCNKR